MQILRTENWEGRSKSFHGPRVEMFGNEFRWGKTKVSNPSGLNMAADWLRPIVITTCLFIQPRVCFPFRSLAPHLFTYSVSQPDSQCRQGLRLRPRVGRFIRSFPIPCPMLWCQYWRGFPCLGNGFLGSRNTGLQSVLLKNKFLVGMLPDV